MAKNLSQAARVFFNYEALLPFLFGSVCLGVLSNAVYQILVNWLGGEAPVAVGIALAATVVLVFAVWSLGRFVKALQLEPPDRFITRHPAPHKGLILMVSRLDPSVKAIEYHAEALQQCWLICSIRTLDLARQLIDTFPKIRFPEPVLINDIHNPLEYRDCVQKIYQNLPDGWQESDVIADYLGMTSHASVGMALACVPARRPLQYTPARYDEQLRPVEPLDPIEIVVEP